MTDTPQVLLAHHLKTLKLPTFLREYDKLARQCATEGADHVRYLVRLTELEWTAQGWLYLAVMLDLYSRRVIGWAVGARMTSDLPLRALNRAIGLRQPGAGVIHHSDRGSQYCSDAYQARLGELGFLASMSGKGNCYDNAVVETFFKTIKSELIWRTVFMSRSQAETAIAGYIDGFYNPVRRHSTRDFTSPVKFEAEAMQTV